MTCTALVCSEPIRACMGGIGIRYFEFARQLTARGVEVTLFSPGDPEEVPPDLMSLTQQYAVGRLASLVREYDGVVAQGLAAYELAAADMSVPLAIDLYDPFLIENLAYAPDLGPGQYRQDLAAWRTQLGRGDFFLCASEAQRLYYLGFLTSLGRIGPEQMASDATCRNLITAVPYGTETPSAEAHPVLPPRRAGEKRIFFGGLYDWYDPWPLLHGLEEAGQAEWTLLFMRHPNASQTPQRLLGEIQSWIERQSGKGVRIEFYDWVSAVKRFDLLRDVDVMVVPHAPGIETQLSQRTRIIDALAVGCPVVASQGGALSDLLVMEESGWVVPTGDGDALIRTLDAVLQGGPEVETRRRNGYQTVNTHFAWDQVLDPLIRFCRHPVRSPSVVEPPKRHPTLWSRLPWNRTSP
jgi:glycosyltransferase involved in cell wall biosynthesis